MVFLTIINLNNLKWNILGVSRIYETNNICVYEF